MAFKAMKGGTRGETNRNDVCVVKRNAESWCICAMMEAVVRSSLGRPMQTMIGDDGMKYLF